MAHTSSALYNLLGTENMTERSRHTDQVRSNLYNILIQKLTERSWHTCQVRSVSTRSIVISERSRHTDQVRSNLYLIQKLTESSWHTYQVRSVSTTSVVVISECSWHTHLSVLYNLLSTEKYG